MKQNICRPFILYHDFIPVDINNGKYAFTSLGAFDGLDVCENIFEEKTALELLWRFSNTKKWDSNESYQAQIIYGFRAAADEEEYKYEQIFWDSKVKNNKFLFMMLIQSDGGNLEELWEDYKKLEYELNNEVINCIGYLTLDISDIIYIISSDSYSEGRKCVEKISREMRQNLRLKYSFTILSLNKEMINKKLFDSEERITAFISFMQNSSETVDISLPLEDAYEQFSVLGCEDNFVELNNISWNEFLDNHCALTSEPFTKTKKITNITTVIGEKMHAQAKISLENISLNEAREKMQCAEIKNKCKNVLGEIQKNDYKFNTLGSQAVGIIDALQKFEKTGYSNTTFVSLINPMILWLEILQAQQENDLWSSDNYNQKNEKLKNLVYKDSCIFLNSINLFAQNSIRTDRQFVQALDFDMNGYNMPVRLNLFYNAFAYELKEFLNISCYQTRNHRYEFLACPSLDDTMNVHELFYGVSTKDRLFIINLPEMQIYNPQMMLIMIAHELGHFVGSKIRKRESRIKYALDILVILLGNYYRDSLICWSRRQSDGVNRDYMHNNAFWQRFRNNLHTVLNSVWEESSNQDLHSKEIKRQLCKIIKEQLTTDEYKFIYDYLKYNEEYLEISNKTTLGENKKKLEMEIEKITNGLLFGEVFSEQELSYNANISNIIEMMFNLFKECIADVICILTLEIKMVDYFKVLLASNNDLGVNKDYFMESSILIRMALVMDCMCRETANEHEPVWNLFEELKCFSREDSEMMKLKDNVMSIYQWLFCEHEENEKINKNVYEANRPLNAIDLFFDCEIVDNYAMYLMECRENFYCSEELFLDKKRKIMRLYNIVQENDIEKFLLEMSAENEKYLNLLLTN